MTTGSQLISGLPAAPALLLKAGGQPGVCVQRPQPDRSGFFLLLCMSCVLPRAQRDHATPAPTPAVLWHLRPGGKCCAVCSMWRWRVRASHRVVPHPGR